MADLQADKIPPKQIFKAQSATEFLLTYGWAFMIIAVIIAGIYLYVSAPQTATSSACSATNGPHCQDLILGANTVQAKLAMLFTNTQSYPIYGPSISLNLSGVNTAVGGCSPTIVLPGGSLICNASMPSNGIQSGALISGKFVLTYIPCPSANASLCAGSSNQNFAGIFNVHATQLLNPVTESITLMPQNTSQVALDGVLDKLTAQVKLLGTPLAGATVNFTSNSIAGTISPTITTTDSSGNAFAYLSSNTPGTITVNAMFANSIASAIITFNQPACVSTSFGTISPSGTVINIDGNAYSSTQNLCYAQGSSHSYTISSPVAGSTGTQYAFNHVSGCGATGQSGSFVVSTNCTFAINFTTQYYLTLLSNPPGGGNTTPISSYINSGATVSLGETPSGNYLFSSWTGIGSGSYSGSSTSPSITVNNPINETASFYTSTTSSTSTSTTSTSTMSTTSTTTIFTATGGTVTFAQGNEIHTFTSSGTFTATGASGNVSVLVVAGGGGGNGGGGGGGGVLANALYLVTPGAHSVTVGSGGSAAASGSNSIFGSIISVGGGYGGASNGGGGALGGSGGGGGYNTAGAGYAGGAGTAGQGSSGGVGGTNVGGTSREYTGGGGGAGQAGGAGFSGGTCSGVQSAQGYGGNGVASSISGSSVTYGGGGGGAGYNCAGSGGSGGGGAGTHDTGGGTGTAGTANLGGGGGGEYVGTGGAGGSGVVIISFNALGNGTP